MAVRIRIRIESLKGKKEIIETIALVNTGYESEEPEIIIPIKLAEKLGIWPKLPENSRIEEYGTVGGIIKLYWIPYCVKVKILTKDKTSKYVRSHVTISEFEREVLLSDKLAGALGIVIENIGKGYWRFPNEKKIRKSEKPEKW